jgi:hypothetical protein
MNIVKTRNMKKKVKNLTDPLVKSHLKLKCVCQEYARMSVAMNKCSGEPRLRTQTSGEKNEENKPLWLLQIGF